MRALATAGSHREALRAAGVHVEWLREELGVDWLRAAFYLRDGGVLQPFKLAQGLADRAEAEGVEIPEEGERDEGLIPDATNRRIPSSICFQIGAAAAGSMSSRQSTSNSMVYY